MPSRRHQNRRRPVAQGLALRRPPAWPVLDRDLLTAAVGLLALGALLLLG